MVVHVDKIESFRSDNEYKYDQQIFIAGARNSPRGQCACVRDKSHKAANSWSHLVARQDCPEKSYS